MEGCFGVVVVAVILGLTMLGHLPGAVVWVWLLLWLFAVSMEKSKTVNNLLNGMGMGAFILMAGGGFVMKGAVFWTLLIFVVGAVVNVLSEKLREGIFFIKR